jgi:hypothetical protein
MGEFDDPTRLDPHLHAHAVAAQRVVQFGFPGRGAKLAMTVGSVGKLLDRLLVQVEFAVHRKTLTAAVSASSKATTSASSL